MKKYNVSLGLLRIFAMLLIINSHMDILYPQRLSFLATGGAIGNELFFVISGFFLPNHSNRKVITKRFLRLYIPTWIIVIISLLLKQEHIGGWRDVIRCFIYPTPFWFVSSIFLFSIIISVIDRLLDFSRAKTFFLFSLFIVLLDVFIWIRLSQNKTVWMVEDVVLFNGFFYYKCVYSFLMFATGYYIGNNQSAIVDKSNKSILYGGSLLSIILFFLFKLFLASGIIPMRMQIFAQLFTCLCALSVFITMEKVGCIKSDPSKEYEKIIRVFADLSLEAYLVQFLVIGFIASYGFLFPFNLMVTTVGVVFVAFIFRMTDKGLIKYIYNLFGE